MLAGDYELIQHLEGMYFKTFITSINRRLFHWHYDLELLLILEGSISAQIAAQNFVLNAGDLFIINRNEIHGFKSVQKHNCILAVQINPEFCRAYLPGLLRLRFKNHFIRAFSESVGWDIIRKDLIDLFVCSQQHEKNIVLKCASHLNRLVYDVLKFVPYEEMGEESAFIEEKNLERLNRIIGYIQNNYQNKLSLKELARQENLGMYYLSHFIKQKLGISFQEYLNRLRLAKAVELMEKGNHNHLEICLESGFSDYRYLSKMFMDEYGCTPAQYKHFDRKPGQGIIVMNDDEDHIIFHPGEAAEKLQEYLGRWD
jgi:AraC-like DNA-binding protein